MRVRGAGLALAWAGSSMACAASNDVHDPAPVPVALSVDRPPASAPPPVFDVETAFFGAISLFTSLELGPDGRPWLAQLASDTHASVYRSTSEGWSLVPTKDLAKDALTSNAFDMIIRPSGPLLLHSAGQPAGELVTGENLVIEDRAAGTFERLESAEGFFHLEAVDVARTPIIVYLAQKEKRSGAHLVRRKQGAWASSPLSDDARGVHLAAAADGRWAVSVSTPSELVIHEAEAGGEPARIFAVPKRFGGALAYGGDGALAFVVEGDDGMFLRRRTQNQFSETRIPMTSGGWTADVAVGPDGRAVVAHARSLAEGGPYHVEVARERAGGFAVVDLGETISSHLRVVVGADGAARVAFVRPDKRAVLATERVGPAPVVPSDLEVAVQRCAPGFGEEEDAILLQGIAGVTSLANVFATETADGLQLQWGATAQSLVGGVLLVGKTLADVDLVDFVFA